jgi:hypothetical protein
MTSALMLALLLAVSPSQVCRSVHADSSPDADGYVQMGGALIGVHDGRQYTIDHLCNGATHKLLLQVSTGSDAVGNPLWKTLDQVLIPTRGDKFFFAFGERVCRRGTSYDPELVVVAADADHEFLPALQVWRANRAQGRFETVRKRGISCLNEGFGT